MPGTKRMQDNIGPTAASSMASKCRCRSSSDSTFESANQEETDSNMPSGDGTECQPVLPKLQKCGTAQGNSNYSTDVSKDNPEDVKPATIQHDVPKDAVTITDNMVGCHNTGRSGCYPAQCYVAEQVKEEVKEEPAADQSFPEKQFHEDSVQDLLVIVRHFSPLYREKDIVEVMVKYGTVKWFEFSKSSNVLGGLALMLLTKKIEDGGNALDAFYSRNNFKIEITNSKKLYISHLDPRLTTLEIGKHFEEYGHVTDAMIVDGELQVTLDCNDLETACKAALNIHLSKKHMGCKEKIAVQIEGASKFPVFREWCPQTKEPEPRRRSDSALPIPWNVFFADVSDKLFSADAVYELFSRFGEIRRDSITLKTKPGGYRYGFVEFVTYEGAQKAITACNGVCLPENDNIKFCVKSAMSNKSPNTSRGGSSASSPSSHDGSNRPSIDFQKMFTFKHSRSTPLVTPISSRRKSLPESDIKAFRGLRHVSPNVLECSSNQWLMIRNLKLAATDRTVGELCVQFHVQHIYMGRNPVWCSDGVAFVGFLDQMSRDAAANYLQGKPDHAVPGYQMCTHGKGSCQCKFASDDMIVAQNFLFKVSDEDIEVYLKSMFRMLSISDRLENMEVFVVGNGESCSSKFTSCFRSLHLAM